MKRHAASGFGPRSPMLPIGETDLRAVSRATFRPWRHLTEFVRVSRGRETEERRRVERCKAVHDRFRDRPRTRVLFVSVRLAPGPDEVRAIFAPSGARSTAELDMASHGHPERGPAPANCVRRS